MYKPKTYEIGQNQSKKIGRNMVTGIELMLFWRYIYNREK